MIMVRLMGGLGNQMFQYAAGLALALDNQTRLYLDLSWFEETLNRQGVAQRRYELNVFGIKPNKLSLFDKLSYRLSPPLVYEEQNFAYDRSVRHLGGNLELIGYWQSENYFIHHEQEIRRVFSLSNPLSPPKQKLLKQIKNAHNPVSIHVRRGDYVSNRKTKQFHGLMPISYYRKSVEIIAKAVSQPTFIIFSDDPDWCKQHLKFNYPTIVVDYLPNTGHEDMKLMSHCQHHIIANSSFSWWGAWLNESPKKIVITPKKWFSQHEVSTNDVIPKSWQLI